MRYCHLHNIVAGLNALKLILLDILMKIHSTSRSYMVMELYDKTLFISYYHYGEIVKSQGGMGSVFLS